MLMQYVYLIGRFLLLSITYQLMHSTHLPNIHNSSYPFHNIYPNSNHISTSFHHLSFLVNKQVHPNAPHNYTMSQSDNCNPQYVQFEGTLAYCNGCPVSFKNNKILLGILQQSLNSFYFICPHNFLLRFRIRVNVRQNNNEYANYNSFTHFYDYAHSQMLSKLHQTKDDLAHFLIRIGLTSHKSKNKDRLRQVKISGLIRDSLHEILQKHKYIYQQQSSLANNSIMKTQFFSCNSKASQAEHGLQTQSSKIQLERGDDQQKNNQKQKIYVMSGISTEGQPWRECCNKELRNSQDQFQAITYEENPIIKVKSISVEIGNPEQADVSYGGYFTVQKYNAIASINPNQRKIQYGYSYQANNRHMIEETPMANQQIQQTLMPISLAIKGLSKQLQNDGRYENKVRREMEIIRNIRGNQNIAKYFQCEGSLCMLNGSEQIANDKNKCILMEGLEVSLKDIMSKNMYCNWFKIVRELSKAVSKLHECGIVHRDIKPGNVMFDQEGLLKIIDFSESIQCWKQLNMADINMNQKIGFTFPYSPIQCSRLCADGYSNMKIDNWSLGMTICQGLLGNLPICYSKSLKKTIKEKWMGEEFHWCMNLRRGDFGARLQVAIKILCLKLMQNDWRKRLCLDSFVQFLQLCQGRYLQL